MPDYGANLNTHGQLTATVNMRKGASAKAYVRLREWCWQHDVNFADVINGLIGPLSEACINFARAEGENRVVVTLNLGDVLFEKIYARKTIPYKAPPRRLPLW